MWNIFGLYKESTVSLKKKKNQRNRVLTKISIQERIFRNAKSSTCLLSILFLPSSLRIPLWVVLFFLDIYFCIFFSLLSRLRTSIEIILLRVPFWFYNVCSDTRSMPADRCWQSVSKIRIFRPTLALPPELYPLPGLTVCRERTSAFCLRSFLRDQVRKPPP